MWLKGIGFLMIIAATTGIGLDYSQRLSRRIDELGRLRKKMLQLQGEIRYGKNSLPEALVALAGKRKEIVECFFAEVAEELEKKEGNCFWKIWKQKVEESLKESTLTTRDKENLCRFGETMGNQDGETHIRQIELYLEYLEQDMEEAKAREKETAKIYQCLGVMSGILIAIVLL